MSARRPRVIGLDLSLSSTGMSDGQSVHAIQTGPDEPLEARLDRLVRGVVSFALSPTQWTDTQPHGTPADLAVIEGAAYRSHTRGQEDLAALRVMVRHRLWRLGIPFALVPPMTLKRYTTGDGKATKQDMAAAVDARHRVGVGRYLVSHGRYDMADAFALAAMGYDHVGHPLPDYGWSAGPCRAAMDAVQWPELICL